MPLFTDVTSGGRANYPSRTLFSAVGVAQSLVFCIVVVDHCLSFFLLTILLSVLL